MPNDQGAGGGEPPAAGEREPSAGDGGSRRTDGGRPGSTSNRSDVAFPGLSGRSLVTDAVEATAVSGGTVVLASAATVLVLGHLLDVTSLAVVGFLSGVVLAVASWFCNRRGPLSAAAGSLAVAIGVLAVAYALSRPISDGRVPLHVGATIFAFASLLTGLGAGATISGSLGSGQWLRTVLRAVATSIVPVLVVTWAIATNVAGGGEIVDGVANAFGEGVDALVYPVGPNANVGGFLALAAFAGLGVAVALRTVPVVKLVRKERRGSVSRATERTRTWLFRLALLAVPTAVVLTATPSELLHGGLEDLGVESPLRTVVDAYLLRAMLGAVGVLGFAAALTTVSIRKAANVDGRGVLRVVATTTPGGGFLIAVAALRPEMVLSRLRVGPVTEFVQYNVEVLGAMPVALAVLVALVIGTTAFLSVVTTAAAVGFIPNRTAAPSVAAGGVLMLAVAVGVWPGDDALLVFVAVAVSMIVWDVGNYGVDVTAELAGTTSRAVEVLHAAGSLLVGGVLVGVALVALWASDTLAAGGGLDGPALVSLVLLVVASVVLMSTLRG